MDVPVIKPDKDVVVVSARFSNLIPGSRYRLGLGAAAGDMSPVKFELIRESGGESKVVEMPITAFKQAHNWWGLKEIVSRGCELDGALLSGADSRIVMRVSFTREFGDNAEKLYVFVAKNYGQNTWYIEDGAEMTKKYW